MKILQLISSSGFFGAENVLVELSCGLKSLGHSVTVGVFRNHHNPNIELVNRAGEVSLRTRVFECKGRLDTGTISAIGSYVKDNSIDIIHSHGYKSNVYALLSNIRTKRALVATCHNWINNSSQMRFYTFMDKLFLKRFDAVVPVSRTVCNLLIKAGIDEEIIHPIENGVNLGRFGRNVDKKPLLKEFGIRENPKIIGTVGRLTQEKGHAFLLEAAKKLLESDKNIIFLLIGDGALKSDLQNQAKDLNIADRVFFAGSRSDIPDLLSIMDIFVLPSLTEGQPMALLEAMAARKPIIGTKVGDVSRIVKHDSSGIIVPPRDPAAIATGILFYLSNSEKAQEFAHRAERDVVNHYSVERMTSQYLKVYSELCNGRN